MDFNKYYLDQAQQIDYPVFRGSRFQRGYGLGDMFRRLVSWAIPLLKQHALPLAQSAGKEIVENVASLAKEAIEGKENIKESAKQKFQSSIEKLSKQRGSGKKRRQTKEFFPDIFSSNNHVSFKKRRMH